MYVADADGQAIRRLFRLGDPGVVLWAPSPDGRRVAWLAEQAPGPNGADTAVWVSDLSGRNRRRLLALSDLRDRQGRRVTTVSLGGANANEAGSDLAAWNPPEALAWSADGKSLYLCCAHRQTRDGFATLVVDAALGTALVDARGRWKAIATMTQVSARGPLLVGVGRKPARLLVVNLAEGKTETLGDLKPGGALFAPGEPALSPDNKSVVFATGAGGLWRVDIDTKQTRRLTDDAQDRSPCWLGNQSEILFLAGSRTRGAALCRISLTPAGLPRSGTRRVLLRNVRSFQVLP